MVLYRIACIGLGNAIIWGTSKGIKSHKGSRDEQSNRSTKSSKSRTKSKSNKSSTYPSKSLAILKKLETSLRISKNSTNNANKVTDDERDEEFYATDTMRDRQKLDQLDINMEDLPPVKLLYTDDYIQIF